MLQRWFGNLLNGNGVAPAGNHQVTSLTAVLEREAPHEELPQPKLTAPKLPSRAEMWDFDSFDQIYQTAPANPPKTSYSIVKVAEMVNSPHLGGMSSDAKRAAILMALEAAGAELKDILQDAMLRQRALGDYEERMQKRLSDFEALKGEENRKIQTELDQITANYHTRIQANVDDIARRQDGFRAWQKTKQAELRTISEASAYCSSQQPAVESMTLILERTPARR
jgi:hypothetical protein